MDMTKKLHEQLTEDMWCKGSGNKVSPNNVKQSCAIVLFYKRYTTLEDMTIVAGRRDAMYHDMLPHKSMIAWNDAPSTTFQDVLALFKKHDL